MQRILQWALVAASLALPHIQAAMVRRQPTAAITVVNSGPAATSNPPTPYDSNAFNLGFGSLTFQNGIVQSSVGFKIYDTQAQKQAAQVAVCKLPNLNAEAPNGTLGVLQPCSPPTYQWAIVNYTDSGQFTFQVEHA